MKSSYSTLMQSKFFNPAFNSAIFDGPIRIYFAQFHESLALKIYFMIQQKLNNEVARAKEISKATGANILVMVYPSEESGKERWMTIGNNISETIQSLKVETIGLSLPRFELADHERALLRTLKATRLPSTTSLFISRVSENLSSLGSSRSF